MLNRIYDVWQRIILKKLCLFGQLLATGVKEQFELIQFNLQLARLACTSDDREKGKIDL